MVATIVDTVVMGRRHMKITFNGTPITPLKLSNPNELQWASHQALALVSKRHHSNIKPPQDASILRSVSNMSRELRMVHVEANVKKRKGKLLEIFIEPSRRKISRRDESKVTIQGLDPVNPSCTLPGTFPTTLNESPVSCNEVDGKLLPSLRSEEMENLGELLEGFTSGQQPENQQHSGPQIYPADCSQFVGEGSPIKEEERYGDLLENLIASVSPDELLFKLSIGNEIPEDFAPLDREEQPVSVTQGALNPPDNLKPEFSATDCEIYEDLQEMINQPNSIERRKKYSELDIKEQTNAINNLDRECSWNNQKIALEKKFECLEAIAEKVENDEKSQHKEAKEFSPDQVMMERRRLSVMLEDLLEEVDSLVCQKGSDGKTSRQRKQILSRRIQAQAHANSCAIDEIGKIQRALKVSKSNCWKTNSEIDVNEQQTFKRNLRISDSFEDSEVLCVKRQRAGDGSSRILQECTGTDGDAPKEHFMPTTSLWHRQKVTTEEHKAEGETINALAAAYSKEKPNSLAKEATFNEPSTMVGSVESISSENQVELYGEVTLARPTEKQDDKLIKQQKHATPLNSMTSKSIVASNGLSFTLQFESQVVSTQKPTLELGTDGVETMKKNLEPYLRHMEDVKMEWRKTHRGSVNWARKLDVETVLEQKSIHEVSTGEGESSEVGKPAESLQRRVFYKGARPEKERKCKRWLIDQHILQNLLQQSVPTTLESTKTSGRVSEDRFDEDSSDQMSPISLDVHGEELLRKLTSPADSQELSSKSSDTSSDFKDSEEDDYEEEQIQRTPNSDPQSKALSMPLFDLL